MGNVQFSGHEQSQKIFIYSQSLKCGHCANTNVCQARSQPVFSGKPEGPLCLSCTFFFRNERNWMKKSARVSEKLVSPGLPVLQVATRLFILFVQTSLLGPKFPVFF